MTAANRRREIRRQVRSDCYQTFLAGREHWHAIVVMEQSEPMSKTYSFRTIQQLPVSLDVAWDFFSNPKNLKEITPAHLGFNVISKFHGDKMYPGQIIEYTVSPLLNIPLYWMTEISHVEDKKYFVDEQRFGPYALWHHQHHFKETAGGVEMTDIVHYKLPLWFLGDIANAFFVRKQLKEIFDYRYSIVDKLFGHAQELKQVVT